MYDVLILVFAFFSLYFFIKRKYENEEEERREHLENQSI